MKPPIYRAQDLKGNWVEGFYVEEKQWQTNCVRCGAKDVETTCYYEVQQAKCPKCDEKFHHEDNKDMFVTGHIGKTKHMIVINHKNDTRIIDRNTLSIHYSHMLDKDKNKLFASFRKDGIGGDRIHVITYNDITKEEYHDPEVVLYYNETGEIKYVNVSKKKCGDSILFKILANNGMSAERLSIYEGEE